MLNMTNKIVTKMAVTKPFAVTLIAKQLLKCFSSMAPTSAAVEALVPVLVFSCAELREARLLRDSISMVRGNSTVEVIFPNYEFEFYETSMLSEDAKTTLCGIDIILKFKTNKNKQVYESICNKLFLFLLEYNKKLSNSKCRSMRNSPFAHSRHKLRAWMIMTCEFVTDELRNQVYDFIIGQLKNEMQPSTRHLSEILLVKIIADCCNTSLLQKLNVELSKPIDTKTRVLNAVNSNMIVALLYGKTMIKKNSWENTKTYMLELVNKVLPWCMNQQFSIRLHALAILLEIKNVFTKNGDFNLLTQKNPSLEMCLKLSVETSSGNMNKNWVKIKNNFMIFHLDQVDSLSVETLFQHIPRLCDLSYGIDLENHCDVIHHLKNIVKDHQNYPIMETPNGGSNLKHLKCDWLTSSVTSQSDNKNLKDESSFVESGKSQSKINITSDPIMKKNNKSEGLVLIASLLDKETNLGGLTRTAEIFGVSKILVNNIRCLEDKSFQSLSVTSHKWMNVEGVKRGRELESYLTNMKINGYEIVALEQAENSANMQKFKFPKKSCLLLGNEREGIPDNLLCLVDHCVEIPQLGIVRSLNVHVSGAIAIWHFTQQHLL